MSTIIDEIKQFWQKYDQKILIILSLILISLVSFNAGRTYKNNIKPAEIKISLNQPNSASNPRQERILALGEAVERNPEAREITSTLITGTNDNNGNTEEKKDCVLVGSKNSDKYHLPTCSNAKRIKPENIVCFSSKEEAESKGYQPAKDCIK